MIIEEELYDCCCNCPTEKKSCVPRQVDSNKKFAVIVEYPQALDVTKDKFLTGDSGMLVLQVLQHLGVHQDELYICSAVNCRPNTKKEAMLKKAMLSCRQRLISELKYAGVEKVLCLGTMGFSALASAEKNLPVTKIRGKWHEFYGMQVLCTFNPTMVMGVPDYYRDFYKDLEKFVFTPGVEKPSTVELWVPETLKEFKDAVECLESASVLAVDVETTGFSPVNDKLLAVGIGTTYKNSTDGITVVLDEALLQKKAPWKFIQKLLQDTSKEVVFHNAKFDVKFLKVGLEQAGFKYAPNRVHDTMLLNYCLDERPMGRFAAHSLKNLARVYFDAPDYDINMGKWLKHWEAADDLDRKALRQKMHEYLALDVYYTARLFDTLHPKVLEEGEDLKGLYEDILMPGALALADIELHGVLIDRQFYEDSQRSLQERSVPILARLQKVTGIPDFNPNSPKQIHDYFYGTLGLPVFKTARKGKQQEGPTSKPVLKMLKKKYPEHAGTIDDILLYRTLTKTAGTYVTGMLDKADSDDRIRGDFLPHGTATGRLSSRDPNLQNIPEASHTKIEVRNGFIAPPGFLLIEADYSQLELRIAAHLSRDENFINVFVEDRDIHQEVAFAFFNKPADQVTKYERYMAKCMNFGVVYGRGAHSLAQGPEMEYVEEIGGTRWTTEEVGEFFDKFFANFPQFHQWMDEQSKKGYSDQVIISPLGRRRRFPFITKRDNGAVGRQAINTPVQGTASDFTFAALVRIHDRLKDLNEREGSEVAYVVSTVHDSILIEVREDLVDYVLNIVKEEMEDNIPLQSRVPFKSDADVAPRWGEMGKYKWNSELQVLTRPED